MNNITLAGTVKGEPILSHESFGEEFYEFSIEIKRRSEVVDTLICVASELLIKNVIPGATVLINGAVRSRNYLDEAGNRHKAVYVFVNFIDFATDITRNEFVIDGYICINQIFRETPKGRQICDFVLANNRERNGKSDYLPCIAWGRSANRISQMPIGTKLEIKGRMQSREYTKRYEDGSEEIKTAYELSVSTYKVKE